jgi:two-component system, NtrC family, response regulator AtoC
LVEYAMETAQILLVSKERLVLELDWTGSENPGWRLETASSGWDALDRVHAGPGPDLILLELAQGDSDGLHTLRWLRRVRPNLPVVLLASSDDAGQQREALRLGAQDYLIRPLQPRQLAAAIRRSLSCKGGSGDGEIVAEQIEQVGGQMFFVAASPTMRKLRAQAELLAQTSAPVLISGENGSGKELVARLIHNLSVRSGFRFLKIDCATLPGDMLESELFGTVGGNGRTKPGKLELGQRGTLFLDEITEVPASLQAKLLQVLQDGRFCHSDPENPGDMDVRILASIPGNIEQAIAGRRLREDLYYRLSAFTVHVPALRQRKEEIPLLLGHFMNQLAKRYGLPARIFSPAALDACQRHSWPGNLSELERFVKRYLVIGDGTTSLGAPAADLDMAFWNSYLPATAETSQLMFDSPEPKPGISDLKSLVQSVKGETERNAITTALERAGWNRKVAARLLKVSYRTLLYKIEQYHMTPPPSHVSGYRNGNGLRDRSLYQKGR